MGTTVPLHHLLNFVEKLRAIALQSVTYEILPNACHADPAFETSQNIEEVLEFLGRVIRKPISNNTAFYYRSETGPSGPLRLI